VGAKKKIIIIIIILLTLSSSRGAGDIGPKEQKKRSGKQFNYVDGLADYHRKSSQTGWNYLFSIRKSSSRSSHCSLVSIYLA